MIVTFYGGYLDGQTKDIPEGKRYIVPPPIHKCFFGDKPKRGHVYEIHTHYKWNPDNSVTTLRKGVLKEVDYV